MPVHVPVQTQLPELPSDALLVQTTENEGNVPPGEPETAEVFRPGATGFDTAATRAPISTAFAAIFH